MITQDLIIGLMGTVLSLSLVPQVIKGFKEKKGYISKKTSIPTIIGLVVIAICHLTLGLWLAFMIELLTAVFWVGLLFQEIKYANRHIS